MENSNQERFCLKNRYGEKYFLILLKDNIYKFDGDIDYMRCIFDEGGEKIKAIDPPGGPFISVGGTIFGKLIKEINFSDENKCWTIILK